MVSTDWLTLALVVITAFYAWATLRILRANEAMVAAMREEQVAVMRPYIHISIHVRTGTQFLYLLIKNVGKTAAIDLKLSIDKNFYQMSENRDDRNIAKSAAFTNVINSLPPDGQLLFLLGSGASLFGSANNDELSPLMFSVTAEYLAGERRVKESSIIDLRPYIRTDIPQDPIVEELSKMRQSIDSLGRSVGNLR